jgi:hypothetical protein
MHASRSDYRHLPTIRHCPAPFSIIGPIINILYESLNINKNNNNNNRNNHNTVENTPQPPVTFKGFRPRQPRQSSHSTSNDSRAPSSIAQSLRAASPLPVEIDGDLLLFASVRFCIAFYNLLF